MSAKSDDKTRVERASERELLVTRTFNAPVRIVYAAWTQPALFMRWWALESVGVPILSCDMDVRTGGGYSVTFGHDAASAMTFFGKYLDVVPEARLVWTNEESPDGAVTSVTFEDLGDTTLLRLRETYPTKEALDEAIIGMDGATPAQFKQLDALLAELGGGV